jgi:hypothetical protein
MPIPAQITSSRVLTRTVPAKLWLPLHSGLLTFPPLKTHPPASLLLDEPVVPGAGPGARAPLVLVFGPKEVRLWAFRDGG